MIFQSPVSQPDNVMGYFSYSDAGCPSDQDRCRCGKTSVSHWCSVHTFAWSWRPITERHSASAAPNLSKTRQGLKSCERDTLVTLARLCFPPRRRQLDIRLERRRRGGNRWRHATSRDKSAPPAADAPVPASVSLTGCVMERCAVNVLELSRLHTGIVRYMWYLPAHGTEKSSRHSLLKWRRLWIPEGL